MVTVYKKCENCVHNEVCNRKPEYERLIDKITNVDKSKSYEGYEVNIDCTYFRSGTSIVRDMEGVNNYVTRA